MKTKIKTQHTPTPLPDHTHTFTVIIDCPGCQYRQRAVNSHEALLEAVKQYRDARHENDCDAYIESEQKVDDAIAQAEGKGEKL